MEYIDREKIILKTCSNCTRQIDLQCQYERPCEHLIAAFLNEDSDDAVPVVRCRECARAEESVHPNTVVCIEHGKTMLCDDFCSYGERR